MYQFYRAANLDIMEKDARRMGGDRPFVLTKLKTKVG
ncbi:MAG: urease accessory protein UreG [Okeania sp. SIO3I5]|nr:urease accessory protein UreG [Okeania sp. SIO3I5]